MRVINPATVRELWTKDRDARLALVEWLAHVEAAQWRSIEDVRVTFPHADAVKVASGAVMTVFKIKGNADRLIVAIHYNSGVVFLRDFLTHAAYSKGRSKDRHG